MFSSLGQALGWARQRASGKRARPLPSGLASAVGGTSVNRGRMGSRVLQEPSGSHEPSGKMTILQMRWHLTKKRHSPRRESVHKEVETGVCSVCWKPQWVQQAKSGMWRLKK